MAVGASVVTPSLVEAQADFALNVLRNSGTIGSTIFSPISISIALAMVYLGAKDETANQIRNAIAKDAPEGAIHAHFASVLDLIDSHSLNVTLESANKVYVKQDFHFLQSYIDGIKKHYKGQIESVDFSDAKKTAQIINSFVEKATHDRIKDLVKSSDLDSLTRLILVNTIYFKGTWQTQFNIKDTTEADFYTSENTTTKVQMMSIKDRFPYNENTDYLTLQLPYNGQRVTMYILLPRDRDGLDDVISGLSAHEIADLLTAKPFKFKVNVKLPKFKIESNLNLKDALKKGGISKVFDADADLSGITGSKDLSVSDVIHKAFIDVNEEGSEAAAATKAETYARVASIPPRNFTADHPFLFIIAENRNFENEINSVRSEQNILFVGKYTG